MKYVSNKFIKPLLWILIIGICLYAGGRLYYRLTGGFTEGNISYQNLIQNPNWNISTLSQENKKEIQSLLSLEYHYLGKGCQSYVFESADGKYVLKFVKYQRFRPQPWLYYLTFLPGMENYLNKKIQKKSEKLDLLFSSWKLAYEHLKPETGIVYVQLNKSDTIHVPIKIFDKLGISHTLDSDKYEFMLQQKAQMLCPTLNHYMNENQPEKAKELISKLITMSLSEFQRGYADNDHALMQNTGVLNGQPVHIDVGQFIYNNVVKNREVYNQELFNKTWKFRKWLEKHHPELADYLVHLLKEVMGEQVFAQIQPKLNKAEVGIIPFEK